MPKRIWLILLVSIFTATLFAQVDDEYAARKELMANNSSTRAMISSQNSIVRVNMDDTDGQFVIGKVTGERLLYGYPSSAWSSWSCFYIDGVHYSNDFGAGSDPTTSVQLGGGTVAYPFALIPHSGDSSYIRGGWRQSGLDIKQTLQPVYIEHSGFTDGFIFIKYEIANTDATSHTVGVILQMDTMINGNDAAPLGTLSGVSAMQTEWSADAVPPWWFAWETSPGGTGIVGMGILNGFDAVRPNRFAVGSWPSFNSSGTWTYTVGGGSYGDSAVLYRWGIDTLAPGDTMVVATYYGIGNPFTSGSFTFVADDIAVVNCNYVPNPFDFSVFFTNESALTLDDVIVHLDLPDGIIVAVGSEDTLMTGGDHLSSFGSAVMGWRLAIVDVPASDTIHVWTTNSSTSDTFHGYYILEVPAVGMAPQASLVEPTNGAWTSCDDQEITVWMEAENGLLLDSDLVFDLDGSYIDLSDPNLTWDGETLRYVPTTPWTDGALISWGLMEVVDEMGCSLVTPVSGFFQVDLTPPVADNPWPEEDRVLGYTEIPGIWVELYDAIRDVEPASISFEINGDIYTISDPELTYADDTLFFDTDAAGMIFDDGDTVCVSISGVTDTDPDYCDVNEMDIYEWCFSFQIIDLWLPDTHLCPPGDTFLIPVYTENLTGLGITEMEVAISYIEGIIQPIGVETGGTATTPWSLSTLIEDGQITVTGDGVELMGGGILFYIEAYVPTTGTEAAYSPLEFIEAEFNSGELSAKPVDGFVTICFTDHIWTNDIIFYKDAQNQKVLTLGGIPGATDGYDGLDLMWVPAPIGKIDAWFDLDDSAHPTVTKLLRDFRNTTPMPIVWEGYAGRPGMDTVSIRWTPAHFPDGRVILKYTDDGVDHTYDMRRVSRATFTDEINFTITYSQPEIGRAQMAVCPGWNLISFPFIPNEGVKISDAVATSITPGYWFNPGIGGYSITEYAEPGKGYWVYCTDHDTFDIAGMIVAATELPLWRGWNMFGLPWEASGTIPASALDITPDVLIGGNIFGFDACGSGSYFGEISDFEVGQGYWLLASGSAGLYIEGDTAVGRIQPAVKPEFTFQFELEGEVRTIGLDSRAEIGLDAFDRAIPPADPYGFRFEGLIADGIPMFRDVKPGEKAEFVIESDNTLMTWNTSDIPEHLDITLVQGFSSISMKDIDHARIDGSAKIIVQRHLPQNMVLHAAVPNPFNPATEIKYSIPEAAAIDMSVYDLMGRKVKTIVSGEKNAGNHTAIWNGTDHNGAEMPTGVYFYRIVNNATGESMTKSMVLLK